MGAPPFGLSSQHSRFKQQACNTSCSQAYSFSKFPTLLTLIEHAGQNAGSAPGGAVAGNARRARAWCGWLRWRGLVRFGVYKAGGCWARLRPNGRATALEGTGSGRRAAGQAAWAAFAGPLPSGRGQAWASPALATSAAAIVRFRRFHTSRGCSAGPTAPGLHASLQWWIYPGVFFLFIGLRPTPLALCHSPVYERYQTPGL